MSQVQSIVHAPMLAHAHFRAFMAIAGKGVIMKLTDGDGRLAGRAVMTPEELDRFGRDAIAFAAAARAAEPGHVVPLRRISVLMTGAVAPRDMDDPVVRPVVGHVGTTRHVTGRGSTGQVPARWPAPDEGPATAPMLALAAGAIVIGFAALLGLGWMLG